MRHIRHVATCGHIWEQTWVFGVGQSKGPGHPKDTPALLADTSLRSGTSLPSERFLKY